MVIVCRHCDSYWTLPDEISAEAVQYIKSFSDERSVRTIKALRDLWHLDMMDIKNLLEHVPSKPGLCFNCQAILGISSEIIRKCKKCGTINLNTLGV